MFARTVAKRVNEIKGAYVTNKAIDDLWKPLVVSPHEEPSTAFQRRLQELGKKSGLEIREGHAYEGKAALFNNPFKVIDLESLEKYGQLNNMTDSEMQTIQTQRQKVVDLVDGTPVTKNAGGKVIKKEVPAWTKSEKDSYFETHPKDGALYKANLTALQTGRTMFRKILKHGGHFNKAHVASVEWLIYNESVWAKGKGTFWLDPDYLAYEPPSQGRPGGRWVVIELKKGYGKMGEEEAQQLRKVAGLLRKWTLQSLGALPVVELYFAAGAASNFSRYEFTREKAYLNTSNDATIKKAMTARNGSYIPVYRQVPVHLLTGRGFANFVHLNHPRVVKMTTAATKAYNFTRGWNSAQNHLNSIYKTANNGRVIPIKNDLVLISKVPEHWRPRNVSSNFDSNIRNVAKLQAYRSSRSQAYKAASNNNPKKKKYLIDIIRTENALLSNKYRKYLNANFAKKLEEKRVTRQFPYSPNQATILPLTYMGPKIVGKILKFRPQMRVNPGQNQRVTQLQFSPSRITAQHVKRENVVYPSEMSAIYLNSLRLNNIKKLATNFATILPRRNLNQSTRNMKTKEFTNFKKAWQGSEHAKTLQGKEVSDILKRLNATLRATRTEARVTAAPAEAPAKKRGRGTPAPNRNNSPLKQAKSFKSGNNNGNKMSN
jgi:hypothetical protein